MIFDKDKHTFGMAYRHEETLEVVYPFNVFGRSASCLGFSGDGHDGLVKLMCMTDDLTPEPTMDLVPKAKDKHTEGFMSTTSSELFKELGMSNDEAEKEERGLNAVIRRFDMKVIEKLPDRIYATPQQQWSPFPGDPAVEYVSKAKVDKLVTALQECSKKIMVSEFSGTSMLPECVTEMKRRAILTREALKEYKEKME